jgi:hypothetical protein
MHCSIAERAVLWPIFPSLQDNVMKIPEELQKPLLAIVEIGIQNILVRSQKGHYELCEAEAYHIHNIPDLLQKFSADRLAYYLEVELPGYLRDIGGSPRDDFLVHWESLRRWLADFRQRSDSKVRDRYRT